MDKKLGTIRKWQAGVVFLFVFALYFFTRSPGLDGWDSVQFAMGVRQFDLWNHQPHPTGYPLYIFFGWMARTLFHVAPEISLQVASCLGGALLVTAWFLIVRKHFDEPSAWLIACTLAVTPIVWMTSTRVMSDALAIGLLSAQLFCALLYRKDGGRRHLIWSALLGAAASGVRPQLVVLVVIVLATVLWQSRAPAKIWLTGIGVCVAGSLVWLLPMWYLQWRLRPEFSWWAAYPTLLYEMWRWRLDKPSIYVGAGGWSFVYLEERFFSHILGWFSQGLGFARSAATLVAGGVLSAIGAASYFLHRRKEDRDFWKMNWAWATAHILIVFASVPGNQRHYLPIYPLVLIPITIGFFRLPKIWKLAALSVPALLFCISLPLAIDNHTRESPTSRFARYLTKLYSPEERQDVLLVLGATKRTIEWYAPDFPIAHVASLEQADEEAVARAAAIYTDNPYLKLTPAWHLVPVARFERSELISAEQSEVELYKIEAWDSDLGEQIIQPNRH